MRTEIKKTAIVMTALVLAESLCGCGNDVSEIETGSVTESEISTITNPFTDSNSELVVEGKADINYGVSVNLPEFEYLTYENGKLTLPLTLQNEGGDLSVGIMVFADGILQEYSSDTLSEKTTMQTFSVEPRSVLTCELYIEDIKLTENAESVPLSFICIADPQDTPTADTLGLYHIACTGLPIHLKIASPADMPELNIENEYDSHVITESEAFKFAILLNDDSACSTGFNLDPGISDERSSGALAASPDGKMKLKLYADSVNDIETTYRVSFYKNHEKITFNGGSDYIDIAVRDGYMGCADIELENINEGDFIYCIGVPTMSYNSVMHKSVTIPILNEADIPEKLSEDRYFMVVPSSDNTETVEEIEEDIPEYSPDDYYEETESEENDSGWVFVE